MADLNLSKKIDVSTYSRALQSFPSHLHDFTLSPDNSNVVLHLKPIFWADEPPLLVVYAVLPMILVVYVGAVPGIKTFLVDSYTKNLTPPVS